MSALQAWISTIASKHVDMTEDPKKYVCDFAGCEKSFKRADYLERHRANRRWRKLITDKESTLTEDFAATRTQTQRNQDSNASTAREASRVLMCWQSMSVARMDEEALDLTLRQDTFLTKMRLSRQSKELGLPTLLRLLRALL